MSKEKQTPKVNESVSFLNQLSAAYPIGIMAADSGGVVYYRNDLFVQWMPGMQIENKLWLLQLLPLMISEQRAEFDNISVSGLLKNYAGTEIDLETNYQGKKIFYRLTYRSLYDDENRVCGIIEVTENTTSLKELEKSLQHARRFETVGRLASGIAHDFNNILQVINGHSEMLLESRKDDPKVTKSLEIILSSGQKASALTRQLLLFSRRQQGEFKQINLGEMLVNMQKILSRMLGEDISMTLQCNDRGLLIEGDESQIEQILMNLAINARDAMPEGGKITISIDGCEINESSRNLYPYLKDGKYLCLHFADSGCGIPQHILEHIFEPFFTTKESGRGTGLGLATVYSIVKQHEGFINVESEIGKGTAFTVFFPLTEYQKQTETAENGIIPQMGCNKRVLVIEDDDLVREFTLQALSQYGYCVKCASNIKQANALLKIEPFDLFFIDIVLPDGDGVGFLESLPAEFNRSAFVLTSGYTEDKTQIKSTLHKGYSYLLKPFNISSLLQACSSALQNRK
jgi:two-component system, cell cycle sensor histidine kinase and response regulator CckA